MPISNKIDEESRVNRMLKWSVIFLVVALIAGIFGFFGIVEAAASIAKVLFFIFIVLFVISLYRTQTKYVTLSHTKAHALNIHRGMKRVPSV